MLSSFSWCFSPFEVFRISSSSPLISSFHSLVFSFFLLRPRHDFSFLCFFLWLLLRLYLHSDYLLLLHVSLYPDSVLLWCTFIQVECCCGVCVHIAIACCCCYSNESAFFSCTIPSTATFVFSFEWRVAVTSTISPPICSNSVAVAFMSASEWSAAAAPDPRARTRCLLHLRTHSNCVLLPLLQQIFQIASSL